LARNKSLLCRRRKNHYEQKNTETAEWSGLWLEGGEKMSGLAVQVENLTKSYGSVKAVDGISFEVRAGEIFGMLGPNGAGKSTTLSVLQGLRRADGGEVNVLGLDVRSHAVQIKQRIGVQLQRTSLLPNLTALAQVELLARLYGRAISRREAMKLLERVSLGEKAGALPSKLSGGQQQRLALALALVNDPTLIFLDEPTAGLDPHARREVWNIFRRLHDEGRTIVMTTHYLEEAETLCQRVAVIAHGKLLALDTPQAIINGADGSASLEEVYLQLTGRKVRET
jgi:ABC-2 type transport system ATP-binding protein